MVSAMARARVTGDVVVRAVMLGHAMSRNIVFLERWCGVLSYQIVFLFIVLLLIYRSYLQMLYICVVCLHYYNVVVYLDISIFCVMTKYCSIANNIGFFVLLSYFCTVLLLLCVILFWPVIIYYCFVTL